MTRMILNGGLHFSCAAQVKRVPQIVDVQQENGILQVSIWNALQVHVVGPHKIIFRKRPPDKPPPRLDSP